MNTAHRMTRMFKSRKSSIVPILRKRQEVLVVAQDNFHDHPIGPNSVVLRGDFELENFSESVTAFVRRHGIGLINYGMARRGFVVTMRNQPDAAMFRLLWPGEIEH